MIRCQGVIKAGAAACEFWGIEDHRAEALARGNELVERLEGVAELEADIGNAVKLGICAGQRQSTFAAIDGKYFAGTAENGC